MDLIQRQLTERRALQADAQAVKLRHHEALAELRADVVGYGWRDEQNDNLQSLDAGTPQQISDQAIQSSGQPSESEFEVDF